MIEVTPSVSFDESEVVESFIRSSGPGGQNVNKVATAVQIRFDVRGSPSLPDWVKPRLERAAGARLTKDGVIVLTAERFRTQERNRADALERLVELIRGASAIRKSRRPTKPTKASVERRLAGKKVRSVAKRMRSRSGGDD